MVYKKSKKGVINIFKKGILSGSALKIIALISMTLDHIGKMLFPDILILQIIGRLAFPIFAYMIAEGWRYTRNRKKYFLLLFTTGCICQTFNFLFEKSLFQCVLITFSLSVATIFVTEIIISKKTVASFILAVVFFVGVFTASEILPHYLNETGFFIDYGFLGIMLPVAVYFAQGKTEKLFIALCFAVMLSFYYGGWQWFSLASVILLTLYNNKKGAFRLKYLFYIYYPLHLAVIQLIAYSVKK